MTNYKVFVKNCNEKQKAIELFKKIGAKLNHDSGRVGIVCLVNNNIYCDYEKFSEDYYYDKCKEITLDDLYKIDNIIEIPRIPSEESLKILSGNKKVALLIYNELYKQILKENLKNIL